MLKIAVRESPNPTIGDKRNQALTFGSIFVRFHTMKHKTANRMTYSIIALRGFFLSLAELRGSVLLILAGFFFDLLNVLPATSL